jgi:hypothetical protein
MSDRKPVVNLGEGPAPPNGGRLELDFEKPDGYSQSPVRPGTSCILVG